MATPSNVKTQSGLHPIFDEIVSAWGLKGAAEPCDLCLTEEAVEERLCRDCWNDVNGQFGVGA